MHNKNWEGPFHKDNPYRKNEKKIMDNLNEIKKLFIEQGFTHPCHEEDLTKYIHGIQDIVMNRICQRNYPKEFPTYENKGGWHVVK